MASASNIGHRHRFVKRIAAALRSRCRVGPGDAVLVACSGGADSVALLRALHALAPRNDWRLKLTVGHVQHHLRDDAEADAAFVQTLASELGLPVLRRDIDVPKQGNVEGQARRLRYAALAGMARECGASFIATAHHGDDQLETLLMRLLRGTGVHGLRGIAWRRRMSRVQCPASGVAEGSDAGRLELDARDCLVIRPMLAVERAAVETYLREIDQPWREDHTNADASRVRARLRRDVLPVLHDLRKDAARRAVELADHMRRVASLLDRVTDDALAAMRLGDNGAKLDRVAARNVPPVVLTAALRRMLEHAGVGADALTGRKLRPIVHVIRDREGGERFFDVRKDVRVSVTRNAVTVTRSNA